MQVTRVGIEYKLFLDSVDQRTVKKYVKIRPKVLSNPKIREENIIILTEMLNLIETKKGDQGNT